MRNVFLSPIHHFHHMWGSTLLASQTPVKYLNGITRHALGAFRSISIRAYLMFDDQHCQPLQNRPHDAGQPTWLAIDDLPPLLASSDHFVLEPTIHHESRPFGDPHGDKT